jgi:microcystin-dependent protein
MSSPFVAEIRIFAGNFAPTGWATCDGQILPISQNTALFSLLGTFYGGDGKSTFALPNLRGSAPMQQGQGPGLSERFIGEQSGEQFVTLLTSEMPVHSHSLMASNQPAQLPDPQNHSLARANANAYVTSPSGFTTMNLNSIGPAGGSLPHNNLMPFLALTFIIALQGVFPARG